MIQNRHTNVNGPSLERSNRNFHTGSFFLKKHIQSFAKPCKDFTKNTKFRMKYTIKTQS